MVYIKLDPDRASFKTLMLHETGHMILMLLNGGKKLPQEQIASIPHTTAALTDRITAFDEGFAIHLETLAVHYLKDPEIQARYNHQNFQFGVPLLLGEYHRIAGDLLSYSQSTTRYVDVRDNAFAFAPANRTANYFRSQMEKSRDFSELRDANQLMQSEGFHASFFFSQLVRGKHPEYDQEVSNRQDKMLTTLHGVFQSSSNTKPYLLRFVERYLKEQPEEGAQIVDVLLDLSHGVFVDPKAQQMWHDHYLNALSMDLAEKNNTVIETARQNWKKQVLANPTILYSLLGPEIPVQIKGTSVLLVAFEEPAPLAFDINTAAEGVLRCIPKITEEEVMKWIAERRTKPFKNVDDFKTRSALSANTLKDFEFVSLLVK
jgi:DNA uptake protein ComE-like DNA-binding protein